MSKLSQTLIGICMAAVSVGAWAQSTDEHQGHHPAGTSAPAPEQKKVPAKAMGAEKMAAMAQHMTAMQAMHEKMVAAKTPDERQALMADHMKLMQDGMSMMKQMSGMPGGVATGGNMAEHHQMMEKRMAMMASMMQMMMDRLPAPAAQ